MSYNPGEDGRQWLEDWPPQSPNRNQIVDAIMGGCVDCNFNHDNSYYDREYYGADDEYEKPSSFPTAEEIEKIDARDQKVALSILAALTLVLLAWLYHRCQRSKQTRIQEKQQENERHVQYIKDKAKEESRNIPRLPVPSSLPKNDHFETYGPERPSNAAEYVFTFGTHLDKMYYKVSKHQEECLHTANRATKLELHLLQLSQQLEGLQDAVTSATSSNTSNQSSQQQPPRWICNTAGPSFQPELGSVENLKNYHAWLAWQDRKADQLAGVNSIDWDNFLWRTNHVHAKLAKIDKVLIQTATEMSALSLATDDDDENGNGSKGGGFQVEGLTGATATVDDQIRIRAQIRESLKNVRANLLRYRRDSLLRRQFFFQTMERYSNSVNDTQAQINAAEMALDDLISLTDSWYWKLDPSHAALKSFQTGTGKYSSSLRENFNSPHSQLSEAPEVQLDQEAQEAQGTAASPRGGDMQPGQIIPSIEKE